MYYLIIMNEQNSMSLHPGLEVGVLPKRIGQSLSEWTCVTAHS